MAENLELKKVRQAMNHAYKMNETDCVNALLEKAALEESILEHVENTAHQIVLSLRDQKQEQSLMDAFLYEYELTSNEGIALMCLAEAMLRIPDSETVDDLIRDKLAATNWSESVGKSSSFFVNASTWALMLTGKIVSNPTKNDLAGALKKLVRGTGEPVIRLAVGQAMKALGKQFVMGQTIEEALKRSKDFGKKGYQFSYDMLGEAARTEKDAQHYFESYENAIKALAQAAKAGQVEKNPGISVKLSALHPRYDFAKHDEVVDVVSEKLLTLAKQAKAADIGLTVDAEEARVLELSLDIFERVYANSELDGWEGFGLAVQSYQKRAPYVLDWLIELYKQYGRKMMVRLIKGAYWDSEIKYAQVQSLEGYPVFTRKASTDVSYIVCVKKMLENPDVFYPMFGTHNAYSVAVILSLTKTYPNSFEFQCLHGMGYPLYDQVIKHHSVSCRVYAPVGGHRELLAYLVRRLLENGANSSFVNRLADKATPIAEIIADPVKQVAHFATKEHPKIPLPRDIYGAARLNSKGIDLSDHVQKEALDFQLEKTWKNLFTAAPIVNGKVLKGKEQSVLSPIDQRIVVGTQLFVSADQVEESIKTAREGFKQWKNTPVHDRAQALRKAADILETRMIEFMAVAVREAGKTLVDAIAEVREAVDFCRYYANEAERIFVPQLLKGVTGEINQLTLHGRGVFACISPWNFPLAIFLGQVTAALVAGNAVIAKPAEQTSIIATLAVRCLHEAGIPKNVLQLLPGKGSVIGKLLTDDDRIAGVMFTGSTETAKLINKGLANRSGAIVPLIAETGGMNAMIVDSTALLEQVVVDVMVSAFFSAGQRCSALRVLYVQEDIADALIEMLRGAMATLKVGNPADLSTDVGPVIDQDALDMLNTHFDRMSKEGKLIAQASLTSECDHGFYFAPCAFEIDTINILEREVFGPFLHVIRFKESKLDQVLNDISSTGYGLTQGLHTRINEKVNYVESRLHVGNFYVNRNMTGAIVGVQPFGGEGLSGTGPKAGGPHYLLRLVSERVTSIDTTAAGGNASLLMLGD